MENKRKTLLIGVNLNTSNYFEEEMLELENLAFSNDYDVVGKIIQNLKEINKAFYIGTGKIKEIKEYIDENEIQQVIVNQELSPKQITNLEKEFKVDVMDRTMLILNIFASRASSREAKIQVRLAYLQFMLPRLIGSKSSLDRQRGGLNKGVGEKFLELDRRNIGNEISKLKKELFQIEKQTILKNKQKDKTLMPKISLVGYTNAGKSSLMNLFLDEYVKDKDKKVFEKDLLFATLDTTSRRIEIDDNQSFILSDTVGFISNLPTLLIKSFNSTLKEVKKADFLLHVIDFSSPDFEMQKQITLDTLKEIGADDIPIFNVYNKIDLPSNNIYLQDDNGVYMSCSNREGFAELIEMIKKRIFGDYLVCKMLVPYEETDILAYFSKNSKIINKIDKDNGVELKILCKKTDYYKFIKYMK